MKLSTLSAVIATLALGACSGASGLTTSSVSGTGATAVAAAPTHDATSRAMQVGTTSARATKCGYNFDAAKLKANFLAAEAKINPADAAKAEQVYGIGLNGVTKAVATNPNFCSPAKTAEIKEALTRHLAGDFTPTPPKPEPVEVGFFDTIGDGNGASKGPGFGSGDWWDAQSDAKKK